MDHKIEVLRWDEIIYKWDSMKEALETNKKWDVYTVTIGKTTISVPTKKKKRWWKQHYRTIDLDKHLKKWGFVGILKK
jgi:hypothetical protein